jgi:hypothetical protein
MEKAFIEVHYSYEYRSGELAKRTSKEKEM